MKSHTQVIIYLSVQLLCLKSMEIFDRNKDLLNITIY